MIPIEHMIRNEKAYVNNKSSQIPSAISGFQSIKNLFNQNTSKKEYIIPSTICHTKFLTALSFMHLLKLLLEFCADAFFI